MVKDPKKLAEYIQSWIKFQVVSAARAQSLVVGVSGGVDSALVYALCRATGIPTYGVVMPCHSSDDSTARANEVLEKFGGERMTVDLADAFKSIQTQVSTGPMTVEDKNASEGALRSCLRAPTLDYVAKLHKGIIVGTGNRDEDEVVRYFQKRGDGAVDISPIAKLHKSEVYELAKYMEVPQSVIDAVPSADLWGPDAGQKDEDQLGMTYSEIENATKIVEKMFEQTQGQAFLQAARMLATAPGLDPKFLENLNKLGEMEIRSRHKSNPSMPVLDVRSVGLGLVE